MCAWENVLPLFRGPGATGIQMGTKVTCFVHEGVIRSEYNDGGDCNEPD